MAEECRTSFTGTVFSGVGHGSFYVSIYSRSFRVKLGINPYPGTLNVRLSQGDAEKLDECLRSIDPVIVDPPSIPGAKLAKVLAYPALVGGIDAYLVKPLITIYKSDVAEFISEVYLRGALRLRDGDRVVFTVGRNILI